MVKKKKIFGLEWCFDPFVDDTGFFSKRMFGGLAAYIGDKMVMVLAEDPGKKDYRDEIYDFDIWNGVMFPTSREFHKSLREEFPQLVSHPILGKWLYLPMTADNFEEVATEAGECIARGDGRFGVVSSRETRKKSKKKAKKKAKRKKNRKKNY